MSPDRVLVCSHWTSGSKSNFNLKTSGALCLCLGLCLRAIQVGIHLVVEVDDIASGELYRPSVVKLGLHVDEVRELVIRFEAKYPADDLPVVHSKRVFEEHPALVPKGRQMMNNKR